MSAIPTPPSPLPAELTGPLAALGMQRTHKRRHEFLFHMGDPVYDRFYAIDSGYWKCGTVSLDGEQDVIAFHGKGGYLGLDELHAERRSYSAVALSNSTVLEFPIGRVLQAAEQDEALRQQLQTLLLQEIGRQHRIAQIQRSTRARQKIAAFLLELASMESAGGPPVPYFRLPMSRTDIAAFLGLGDTTVSREFQHLTQSGGISVQGRWLSVLDASQLQREAGQ
ncbi:Crp/Fnr family transcriptional regulator [Pseudoduganella aquatica]|uniref:Helix-turn-helix domain-containing protein n=1 Tax=Pseudoduganella aquatica TaxID=2660641 RepID=A0A7X4KNX5_9BURK|nr:Crp/Fnr family transcriptional regulator [Pseudoduganella aquatica]MYN10779.1 helix-turn-helix domain-containing protein [Pseudoduganella aquatica]